MAERGRRRRPTRRVLIILGAAVIACGGGVSAWAATHSGGDTYRMATAGPGTVASTLNETGTIEPVSEATVDFPVSGQVASVAVSQGAQVGTGQPLAQLNTTSLAASVSSTQSTVATAEAKLASDQASQSDVTTSTGTSSTGQSTNSADSATARKLAANLKSGQTAVTGAQQQVDTDLTLISADIAAAKDPGTACPAVVTYLNSLSATSQSTTPSSTPTDAIQTCEQQLQQALTDETKTSTDEHTLAAAESSLASTLASATTTVGQTANSTASTSTSTSASTGARTSASISGGPASADQIAADQASVDSASAQLAQAQQNEAAATLVSPISGTVAEVNLTAGESTTANSTTQTIVIVGSGEDEITTAVSDSQVGQVKPGQTVNVAPDGTTTPIIGHVTAIGALASTTSSGTASYPVTISLGKPTQSLFDGATASVAITLNSAKAAVTVPTSAVHKVGTTSFVTTLSGDTTTLTRVNVGVQGTELTQITSGLKAGQQVVLADLTTALPTSGSGTTGGGLTRGGGFGGGAGARTTSGG